MLSFLQKPYYVRRPSQLIRRALRTVQEPRPTTVRLPWGSSIHINPQEAIGSAIWRTGVYDLAVTEAVTRLLPPGGLGVDVGANIGYFTTLMQRRAGTDGTVYAFEPHPALIPLLRTNVDPTGAPVQIVEAGASTTIGTAAFALFDVAGGLPFEANNGVAHIAEATEEAADEMLTIRTTTLDAVLPDSVVDLLKIDVEGHEHQVLLGAQSLLEEDRIRTIVFEDHEGFSSDVVALLRAQGYDVRRLSSDASGLCLRTESDDEEGTTAIPATDPPGYVATRAPHIWTRLASPGWESLQN